MCTVLVRDSDVIRILILFVDWSKCGSRGRLFGCLTFSVTSAVCFFVFVGLEGMFNILTLSLLYAMLL